MLAGMAELADALDLGSSAARRAGSSPVPGTTLILASNPYAVKSFVLVQRWVSKTG